MNESQGLLPLHMARKSEEADQIINATLKALDLVCGMFELHFHGQPTVAGPQAALPAVREFHAGTPRRHEERIVLENAADDDQRMRAH